MKLKKPSRRFWVVTALMAAVFLCPIITKVSEDVVIRVIDDRSEPFAGVSVRQDWGVYGWGGFGGTDTRATNHSGEVTFPSRYVVGFLGMRAIHRGEAFVTQCMFGLGSGFIERWGPIVGFEMHLPPGMWLPATWGTEEIDGRDLGSASVGDGLHRYFSITNLDPSRPIAYLSGDQLGFLDVNDTMIVLRLRKASDEEGQRILSDHRRESYIEMIRREGR